MLLIKSYRSIKSSIKEEWVTTLQQNTNEEQLIVEKNNNLQRTFYFKLGKEIKNSLKQIQSILNNDRAFKPNYITKWESSFNVNINWKKQWISSLETPLSNTEKQLHWKIVHNAVFTEYKLSLMGRSDGKCHFCS